MRFARSSASEPCSTLSEVEHSGLTGIVVLVVVLVVDAGTVVVVVDVAVAASGSVDRTSTSGIGAPAVGVVAVAHPAATRAATSASGERNFLTPIVSLIGPEMYQRPRQESNLRSRFRKPMLYPLSYGGKSTDLWSAGPPHFIPEAVRRASGESPMRW